MSRRTLAFNLFFYLIVVEVSGFVASPSTRRQLQAYPKQTRRFIAVSEVSDLDVGVVIAASPNDYGHFTQKSVAFVFERSQEATKAVVLDKASPFGIGEMMGVDIGPLTDNRLYRGGEDGGSGVVLLHKFPIDGAQRVGDTGLYVGGLQAAIAAVDAGAAKPEDFKFFFNFMRWSPGNLEEQIERGKWSMISLEEDIILEQSSKFDQELWPAVQRGLRLLKGETANVTSE